MQYKTYNGEHYMRPAWRLMLNRCYKTNSPDYSHYGGRGIKVCERWRTFSNFLQDMGERPKGLTLDRMDNEGDYEPGNCRWATSLEQSLNRRSNVWIELNGKIKSLTQWADELGVKRSVVLQRTSAYNWTPEEALLTPVGQKRSMF